MTIAVRAVSEARCGFGGKHRSAFGGHFSRQMKPAVATQNDSETQRNKIANSGSKMIDQPPIRCSPSVASNTHTPQAVVNAVNRARITRGRDENASSSSAVLVGRSQSNDTSRRALAAMPQTARRHHSSRAMFG